jgi:alpha-beta hydrolase superfamily lysophospholipase
MHDQTAVEAVTGQEHWTARDGAKLFLWEKCVGDPAKAKGVVLFVHGSSMASQPTFDLQVPGRPDSSAMEWFAARGYDTWSTDSEGYGRSTKDRDNNADISRGADDLRAAAEYIGKLRGAKPLLVYGISSGALKAALFAQRNPTMVGRLALDAMVWTGEGSPTLAERKKKLPEFQSKNRRPIDKDSVPTGTYVDMCSKLPIVDPEKITMPTIVMRGQWDGIAGFDDLLEFFKRLPSPDKHFAVMPGISHASFQQKNYMLVYHILLSFFAQPEPVYPG